jgi:hypothetical protein
MLEFIRTKKTLNIINDYLSENYVKNTTSLCKLNDTYPEEFLNFKKIIIPIIEVMLYISGKVSCILRLTSKKGPGLTLLA